MVQYFTSIPPFLVPWIQQQKLFFVASAPLASHGHVNLSPKGFENTFHIVNENQVWYEDLSGSGVETISHIRENARLTIMFCAFEGPPRIVRLWGTGKVHEFDTPEYNALIPLENRQPGSRSVISLAVGKVSTSCGYSIPFFTFKAHRMKLHTLISIKEAKDAEAETSDAAPSCASLPALPKDGLKMYWKEKNRKSIDGLPGLLSAYDSPTKFVIKSAEKWVQDDESIPSTSKPLEALGRHVAQGLFIWTDVKFVLGFLLGWVACVIWTHLGFGMTLQPSSHVSS